MLKRKIGMYFDKKGVEIDMHQMALLSSQKEYREIRKTKFHDGSFVSTVWLGIDHGLSSEAPIIFETMSFGIKADGETDWGGTHCRRYSTEEEAIKGHEEIVELVKKEVPVRKIDLE